MKVNKEYYILIKKLKGFISKYYKNLILKGLIISLSVILSLFLVASTFEYIAWNNILVRTVIFYIFISATILILVFYVFIPLSKLAKIGKTLSYKEAAKIIGSHFPEVSDKLLNTIQLHHDIESKGDNQSMELLLAGIDQKASKLSPIPFKNAINVKRNLRYVKYAVIPIFAILIILIVSPAFIIEPSGRIVNYNEHFLKPLPYTITIENKKLEALQKDDFKLNVTVDGEAVPADIYINDGQYSYPMASKGSGKFSYVFKNLNSDVYFTIKTEDYSSERKFLRVLPKPTIYSFDVVLDYPAYLNRKSDVFENSGDLIVPEGTTIKWLFYAKDTREVIYRQEKSEKRIVANEKNIFQHSMKAKKSFWYTLFAENEYVLNEDSLSFSVQVVEDDYPSIEVNQFQDEKSYGFLYFNGSISDDNGFHSLKFYYRKDSVVEQPWEISSLNVNKGLTKQHFNYTFQSQELNLLPGSTISYYFEVRDNDRLNGYKRSKSNIYQYHLEGVDEIENKYEETSEKLKEKIKNALADLDKINKELEEKREDLFEKKEASWMDKQQLSELLKKQEFIQKQIDELKKMNEDLNAFEDILDKDNNVQLEEKIDELNKMFEQLTTEDLDKVQEMLDQLDKEKINELLQNLEKKNQDLKADLEQNLEIYKQLEFEKKIQETIEKLNKLSEDQLKLAEESKNKETESEEALEKQENISERFEDVEKDIEAAEQLNSEMEQPFDIETGQSLRDSINQEISEASSKLSKDKQKKASENQSQAGQKMDKLAEDLGMMMQSAMASRMGEDVEKMKKILDNLLDLSFNQEELIEMVNKTTLNDPKYVENLADLQLLKDGYLILHDSLIALSKRQMAVQQFIVKESDKINLHINRALLYLQDRKKGQALNDQQYSMTSMNNLALMLSESLDQMQSGMQSSGDNPGKSCPNPGQGKPESMESMIQMQQGLNKGMKNGQKENGLNGDQGLNQQSEELARMAATQREVRRKLSEYLKQLEGGQGNSGDLSKLIDEMKKTEEDIVNRRITKETLERQKQIEVRLLKSEKAKLEREKKESRESVEGINRKREDSATDFNKAKEKNSKEDFLQTVPIEMTPYFNELLKSYLYKLETNDS